MLATAFLAASLAFGCGPDLITQTPVLCDQVVRPPYRAVYPVRSNGQAGVAVRTRHSEKALTLVEGWGCEAWYRRLGIVALISRCGPQISVAVFRVKAKAPERVRIQVAGSG